MSDVQNPALVAGRFLSMQRLLAALIVGLLAFASSRAASAAAPFLVVLKLDDMRAASGEVPPRWRTAITFAEERRIKISIGVICDSLVGSKPAYFAELRRLGGSELFELWHHGYDHKQWKEADKSLCEFRGPDEATQSRHLRSGMKLAQEKIGVTFTTFGAPFNATDDVTARVLEGQPEITVWLYGNLVRPAGKHVAARVSGVNIEQPTHVPNLAAIKNGLAKHPGESCYVIQGHPNSWDEAAFAEFTRIVDYLQVRGAVFILPREIPAKVRASFPVLR